MDFYVADFENGDNAKDILSRSDKEFSVIFSKEEMEKLQQFTEQVNRNIKEYTNS